MSRGNSKFWLNSDGSEKEPTFKFSIQNLDVKYYQDAGVMRISETYVDRDSGQRKFKGGATIHLDRMDEKQLETLDVSFGVVVSLEKKERAKPKASPTTPTKTADAEVNEIDEYAKYVAATDAPLDFELWRKDKKAVMA